jgi:iron complex transport system substrate-binding protein
VRDAAPVSVAALEWLDPVFVGGHWTPQLIEYAGGVDLFGLPGEPSATRSWEELRRPGPRSSSACRAATTARAHTRRREVRRRAGRLGARRVVAVDGSAYFSRPGPRLVDGLELMAHILHPDLVPDARGAVRELYL